MRKFILVICLFVCIVDVENEEEFVSAVLPRRKSTNWFTYLGKTYYVDSIFKTNFFKAIQFCRQQGMQLLTITSEAENEKIGKYIKDNGFINLRFWTSATNLANDDKWVWLSTGGDVTFFKWYPGEPNKYKNIENCIEAGWFGTAGFTWNDLECNRTDKHFICEATTDCYNLRC